jgi:hypothetical protein
MNEFTKKIGFNRIDEVYYFKSFDGDPDSTDILHVVSELKKLIEDVLKSEKVDDKNLPYIIWGNINSLMSIFHKHPSWAHEKEKRFVILKNLNLII